MRFSLFYLPADPPGVRRNPAGVYRDVIDEVVEADRLGFEIAWFAEHHFSSYGGLIPSIPVLAATIAARTERIRLGAAAAILPLRDAIETAEAFAMVDVLSNGRLEMGVGRGFLPLEFEARGLNLEDRSTRFLEGLDVLLQSWANEPLSFSGRHYNFTDVDVLPKPIQRPHPPIWVAASVSRETFELAGQRGFHLLINPYTRTDEELTNGISWYLRTREAAGHDPASARIMANQHLFAAESEAEARLLPREALLGYLAAVNGAFGRHRGLTADTALAPTEYESVYPSRVLFGCPDALVERVRGWEDIGITDICLSTQFGGLDPHLSRRSLRLFAETVMPRCC